MHKIFSPRGVCAARIEFDIDENGVLSGCRFTGGCDGNHKGLCALVEGRDAADCAERLRGIRCGMRQTSCPDQLSRAIREALDAPAGDPSDN